MSVQATVPRYMAQLLEELGWNQGTRIPLANSGNQDLESLLISRQNEIQQLKESLQAQKQKQKDLDNYRQHVHTEYQENTRLLFAHKQQLEQEIKLRQLSLNEVSRLDRELVDANKKCGVLDKRVNRYQDDIARLLKKADDLKKEVCGERGALQEWRAALDRSANDITAIEQFTKQDFSKAKALETKRQKLKLEHDRQQSRLTQLVSDLSAEERACERISIQVKEGMEQRQQMMAMWAGAVENLRQRDTDIRHIREDYAVLESESSNIAEQCREQQSFYDQQRGNNADAAKENTALAHHLSQLRLSVQLLLEQNVTLDSEDKSLQRELANMQRILETLHMENRDIMDMQRRKDAALKDVNTKVESLKEKLIESTDKTKSSEKRAKQLEDILNDEERYASQLTVNQQRAMHCSFIEQQKLLALKNEEKLFNMQLKASKAVMSKLEYKQQSIERNLQSQKESLYALCYQVETLGARVAHMEGTQAERECNAELVKKEDRLKNVCGRHAARVALLERHSARLHDDMRRLARDLETRGLEHGKLQSRLKTTMLYVDGSFKELKESKDTWRGERVEEALMRLRVAHASRAVAGLDDTAYTLDKQRLQLDAAMNERLVEIAARRDMFNVQKRALLEDCGKLRSDVRDRIQRIDQLKKRYDIFIASLGKDESGQQLSVSFFKIKFAAERAELRERGAALDADIGRREQDVSALEATLRVVHAAHAHFMHHISPLSDDTPEMAEVRSLSTQYYALRDELKAVRAQIVNIDPTVNELTSQLTMLTDRLKQLSTRETETEHDLDEAKDRMARQETRLMNAKETLRHHYKRAKKLIEGVDQWRIFQLAIWIRDLDEAAHTALHALQELCMGVANACNHFGALIASTDLHEYLGKNQRRLQLLISRVCEQSSTSVKDVEIEESVFSSSSTSSRSGMSIASGYTRRLAAFRKDLAPKVQESALIDSLPEIARRSTVSIRVVTLGMEESIPEIKHTKYASKNKKFNMR